MITIRTPEGKSIEIILQSELCDPVNMGEYLRAYCHIHGSDHQRSLSINKATGWGHCFNAACNATVLVGEWNPGTAKYLLHPPKSVPKWQQDELATLLSLDERMRVALAHSERAQAYLNERGITLEVALIAGVRYLPPLMVNSLEEQKQRGILHRWAERLLFPLTSPTDHGYIGRSLWHWQPGMDENVHKSLLDQPGRPRRWIKTNPAGWFSVELEKLSNSIILVEGAFDRLTLLMAGFQAAEIVALAGTAAQIDLFPPQVKSVILAFDSDEGGKEATSRLADQLVHTGICVRLCSPQQDKCGKDWNERWRRLGSQSLCALFEALLRAI